MKRVVIGVIIALVVGLGVVGALSLKNKSDKPAPETTQSTPTEADGDNDMNDMNTSSGSSSSGGDEATQTNSVTIENFAFTPATITVKKGTTVTWTNKDSVGHTVTADSGTGPNSQLLDQGKTYSYTFEKAGTYKYHCTPHPQMQGTVIVE